MNKMWRTVMAGICYLSGVAASLYIGGWMMLIRPARVLIQMFLSGPLDVHMLLKCVVQIALSATVAGLVWCIGYMGCNFFRGTEDEYDRLLKELQERNDKKRMMN